jgi:hypothetical protein
VRAREMGVTLLSWFFLTYVVVGLTNVNLHCHAPVLFSITGILPHLPRLAVVVCTGPLLSLARSLSLSLSLSWYYRIIMERPIGCPRRASLMRDGHRTQWLPPILCFVSCPW